MLNKPKILVTGANGLLGRHAIRSLCEEYEIYAAVHVMPLEPVEKVKYLLLDFSSEWSTDKLPKDLEAIIHLAQSSRFREFPDQSPDIFNVNIRSTAKLLDFAWRCNVKKFIYASSGGIYGSSEIAFKENAKIADHSELGFYLGSKLCSEILVQNYSHKFDVSILRFFFMYGAGQKTSMLIPRIIDSVKNSKSITLQGGDGLLINPIHVSDAAASLKAILNRSGSYTINIAGPVTLSLKKISEIISHKLKIKPIFNFEEGEPPHLIGDITAMKELLCNPKIYFEDGVNDLIFDKN